LKAVRTRLVRTGVDIDNANASVVSLDSSQVWVTSDNIRIPRVRQKRSVFVIACCIRVEMVTKEVLVTPGVERSTVHQVVDGTKESPKKWTAGDRSVRRFVNGYQAQQCRTDSRHYCKDQSKSSVLSNKLHSKRMES